MKTFIVRMLFIVVMCFTTSNIYAQSSLTQPLQLCEVNANTNPNPAKLLHLALWRQCEQASDCGDGHHCCEISGGESRCYSNSTVCP